MQPDSQDSQRTLVDSFSQLLSPKKHPIAISTPRRASPRTNAFSIYSDRAESPLRDILSPKAPSQRLRMIYVEIPRRSSPTSNSPIPLRTPLQQIGQSQANTRPISSMLRKPELKVSFAKGRTWEKSQPNDHTSTLFLSLTGCSLTNISFNYSSFYSRRIYGRYKAHGATSVRYGEAYGLR
jgi:hypothetical protein